jgi:hypothetical protein
VETTRRSSHYDLAGLFIKNPAYPFQIFPLKAAASEAGNNRHPSPFAG